MTPEQELALLRARLLGAFYDISGRVRKVSEGDNAKNVNFYHVTLSEGLAEVEKLHEAYATFARAQVTAAIAKTKEKKS